MTDETPALPNDKLAKLITDKLAQENLIPPRVKPEEVERKLAQGTARAGDWRVWIDLALTPSSPEADDEK